MKTVGLAQAPQLGGESQGTFYFTRELCKVRASRMPPATSTSRAGVYTLLESDKGTVYPPQEHEALPARQQPLIAIRFRYLKNQVWWGTGWTAAGANGEFVERS